MMTAFHVKAKYADDDVVIHLGRYQDQSIALRLMDAETGEPVSIPTVCLIQYEQKPAEGNVFIRDYGASEGMVKGLQDAEIIGAPIREIPIGMDSLTIYECPLLVTPDDSRCKLI